MKNYSIIFIALIFTSCIIAQNNSEDLIGKWMCYHKELENITTENTDLLSGVEFEYTCDGLTIILKKDFTGEESSAGLNFQYQINDTILILGKRSYIIEKLTKTELVLRNFDKEGLNISSFLQKFIKIE